MFDSKKTNLINIASVSNDNSFVETGYKLSNETTSEEGALKYSTTGSDFLDQFAKITNFRKPRSYKEVAEDMSLLWSQNKELSLKLTFYIRMITRKTKLPNGLVTETVQRGQGLKHEGMMRMLWLAINEEKVFFDNLNLFISIGSWKDIFKMLNYDLQYNGWDERKLNWNKFKDIISLGLENENTCDLVKKYLPQIKSNKLDNGKSKLTLNAQANNIIGKWLSSFLYSELPKTQRYKQYRIDKASGKVHTWQQLISKQKYSNIDFNSIHGRALALLISGKFLKNQNLEDKYLKWIETQPTAKYTGYVYELLNPVKNGYNNNTLTKYQEYTINKQFYGLIETAKQDMKGDKIIVVIDSSSSMTYQVPGLKVSAYDVAKSMALYFSYLLYGPFSKSFLEFNNTCELHKWKGDTPVANLQNDRCEAYGSTQFQSIAFTFGKILKQNVKESEFPTTILCVSDGEFAGNNRYRTSNKTTNYFELKENLLEQGFSKEYVDNFKVVLWDIPNNFYSETPEYKFETFKDCPNMFHMSGLDGSAIAFLTGKEGSKSAPKTSMELFEAAMNQETLNNIII